MSLKGKTFSNTNLFLDVQVDSDQITFCGYIVFNKADHQYRDTEQQSKQAFTGEDAPIVFSSLPDVQHGESLVPKLLDEFLAVDGNIVSHPEVFLVRHSQITFKFTDNELMRPNQADTYCNWVFPVDMSTFTKPYNWFTQSYVGKDSGYMCRDAVVAQLSAPYFNAPMADCAVRITVDPRYGYRSNVSFDYEVTAENGGFPQFIKQTMPNVEFDVASVNVPANGTVIIPFKVKDRSTNALWEHDFLAFIECTGGYLPKQRVLVQNGQGELKVTALGLEAGDDFKVKVGARYYTGIDEITLTVV